MAADPVTDAMQAAYAPYRAALFRTNGKSQPEAEQGDGPGAAGLAGAAPTGLPPSQPAPYDRDAQFAATLAAGGRRCTNVPPSEVQRATAWPMHTRRWKQVRDLMAELRHRNDVVVFSDAMNAYHAADGARAR